MDTWPSGVECSQQIAAETQDCILSFSCGKDSIGAWLVIRNHFRVISPYYCYLVPGLEFDAEAVGYYERFFGAKITQVPHPSLYRLLRNCVFQPPERCGL